MEKSWHQRTIKGAFKKTGVWPWDPSAIGVDCYPVEADARETAAALGESGIQPAIPVDTPMEENILGEGRALKLACLLCYLEQ